MKIMIDADMVLVGVDPPGEGKKILKDKGINWAK